MIDCRIDGRKKKIGFEGGVAGLVLKLGVEPEMVIVKRKGKIIPDNEKVGGNDELDIIRIREC